MSTPFAMVGDPDAGVCVDGVCAVPVDDGASDEVGTAASPEDERSRPHAEV
ncbi:hypothetical protein [Lapillicoccus jejuensis]|uniref:Uncharacterized protein n=1 Tax=Lapillicoccus jejuensis TaxID=402171 RepID=A0A542E120_9MICO|nr:hypothetical protein [Lapillicoccus jejuensis]TQJ09015.1 hypothetical protein FB458_2119 [Lapillicoccus jejuensis]